MTKRKFAVVITTISDGKFLNYFSSAATSCREEIDLTIFIIGDLNTPLDCQKNVAKFRSDGFDFRYYTVEEQTLFLEDFPILLEGIPTRSDNRRNVGFLMALNEGCDVIISSDDDNLPQPGSNYFEAHGKVGKHIDLKQLRSKNPWVNICALMDIKDYKGNDIAVYPRGYPHSRRLEDESFIDEKLLSAYCAANIGLWYGDPDIDAATRLAVLPESAEGVGNSCFIAQNKLSPISTQNTAVTASAIPAYYYWRMGFEVGGMKMDRYGDMFSGYCLHLCSAAVGHHISVGEPYVYQVRNDHNLFKDLWHELPGMILVESMRELLETPLSKTNSYGSACTEFVERLESWSHTKEVFLWGRSYREYFSGIAGVMRGWIDACDQIKN